VAPTRTATRIGLLSVVVGAAFALAACSGAAATSAPSPVASPSAQASAAAPAASTAAASGSGSNRYGSTGGASAAPAASATAANAVTVVDFGFNPGTITVKAGTTVTWTNTGVTHTVTSNTGLFDSGHLGTGDTFTFTFSKAGTYAYHCAIHSSMKGEITVAP
jgi:plastocyanin